MTDMAADRDLPAEVVAVLAAALSTIGMSISLATLIFTGPLSEGLPRAIGGFVVAGAIGGGLIAWRSQIVPSASLVQDAPVVVLTAVAAGVLAGGSDQPVIDVFVLLALTTLLTGALMWLFGRFHLGHLVRYMPSTVVAAFIAGTGYLLLRGGLQVMHRGPLSLDVLGDFLAWESMQRWLPGVVLGLLILAIQRSKKLPPVTMSVVILAAVAIFFAVVASASSIESVEADGWLIGPFADGTNITPVTPGEVIDANWIELTPQVAGIAGAVAVAVVALLLNLSALEFVGRGRIDVNRELRLTGGANLLAAAFAGAPVYHALGDTVLIQRMGATRRLVPMTASALALSFGLFGTGLVGFVPRFVVGGLLVTVGTSLLLDWVVGLVRTTSQFERFLSIGIVLVIAFVGILEGIGVGILATCAVFVVRYSRIDPLRRVATGRQLTSRVDRTEADRNELADAGDRTVILQLQGYLFFGSLSSLDDEVRSILSAADGTVDAVVFDLTHVTGIDSSADVLIQRIGAFVTGAGAQVIVASVPEQLGVDDLFDVESNRWFATLDNALEHVETARLADVSDREDDEIEHHLELTDELLGHFEPVSFAADSVVISQGAPSDELVIIRSGMLTAYRLDGDGMRQRLSRSGPGALIGEVGLLTGGVRTAEIIADTRVEGYAISRDSYERLRVLAPDLGFELHEFILRRQAERVARLTSSLSQALR